MSVLADLMRRPGDGKALVARVSAEAFSPGARHELYVLLAKAISAGVPVDPLIAAWQANKRVPGPAWSASAARARQQAPAAENFRRPEQGGGAGPLPRYASPDEDAEE